MPEPSEASPYPADAILPDNMIARVAVMAGWSTSDAATAVAVALAESGGKPASVGKRNSNGSRDFGLFQINYQAHTDLFENRSMYWSNPVVNAQWAKTVWDRAGGSWSPWAAYSKGSYMMYSNRGVLAVQNMASEDDVKKWLDSRGMEYVQRQAENSPLGSAVNSVTAPLNDILKLVGKIFDPKTWVSIGIIVAGAFMLILVGWRVLKDSSAGKEVARTAATVGKVVK